MSIPSVLTFCSRCLLIQKTTLSVETILYIQHTIILIELIFFEPVDFLSPLIFLLSSSFYHKRSFFCLPSRLSSLTMAGCSVRRVSLHHPRPYLMKQYQILQSLVQHRVLDKMMVCRKLRECSSFSPMHK